MLLDVSIVYKHNRYERNELGEDIFDLINAFFDALSFMRSYVKRIYTLIWIANKLYFQAYNKWNERAQFVVDAPGISS